MSSVSSSSSKLSRCSIGYVFLFFSFLLAFLVILYFMAFLLENILKRMFVICLGSEKILRLFQSFFFENIYIFTFLSLSLISLLNLVDLYFISFVILFWICLYFSFPITIILGFPSYDDVTVCLIFP